EPAPALGAEPADSPPAPAQPSSPPAVAPAIVPPRPLGELAAEYPSGAAGDQDCTLELVVGIDGTPRDVRALDCAPPFSSAAEAAALGWRFAPAERNGQPVA